MLAEMTGQDFKVRVLPPRQDHPRGAPFAQPAYGFGPAPVIEQRPPCFDSAPNQAPGGFTHNDVQSREAGTPGFQADDEDFGANLNGNATPELYVCRMHHTHDHWTWGARPLGQSLYRLRLGNPTSPSWIARQRFSRVRFLESHAIRVASLSKDTLKPMELKPKGNWIRAITLVRRTAISFSVSLSEAHSLLLYRSCQPEVDMGQSNQTRETLHQFRERLQRRLQILQLEESRLETELATEVADRTCWAETGDRAQMLAELENGFARRLLIEMSKNRTLRALDRAVTGSYGLCEDCGARIPKERLEVWPEATRCVRCQRSSETMHPLAS